MPVPTSKERTRNAVTNRIQSTKMRVLSNARTWCILKALYLAMLSSFSNKASSAYGKQRDRLWNNHHISIQVKCKVY